MSLARLALVCPFKKMKAEHAELAMETYVGDLVKYDPLLVDAACQKWRTTPGNKFFPTIGELMVFIVPAQQRQDEHARAKPREARQKPAPDMRYTGKYARWEFLSDAEKSKQIALDIHSLENDPVIPKHSWSSAAEIAATRQQFANMGKAFLEREGLKA